MRDLVGTVIWLGALQGALLAPVLWTRRSNRLSNRILGALVAGVTLMLVLGQADQRWGLHGHPHLLGLSAPLPFLFSPLLYLYVIALTRPVVRFDPRWLAHALPFAADVLYMAQVFYLKSGAEKLGLARATHVGNVPLSLHVVSALEVVQALAYLYLTWQALQRYGEKMHGYFSDLERIDLRWLHALVIAHVGVWSIVLLTTLLRVAGIATGALGPVVQLGSSLVIFLTGYVSLWQPELVQKASVANLSEPDVAAPGPEPSRTEPTPAPIAATEQAPRPKYQRNRIDDAEAQELVAKLEALMERQQLYRDNALTLGSLAEQLSITPHMLSQLLNVRVGKSFFVFVNAYRAEALKQALAAPSLSQRGVLELALEVGFSSKSTVNSFFKKHTGVTPSAFRDRALASETLENFEQLRKSDATARPGSLAWAMGRRLGRMVLAMKAFTLPWVFVLLLGATACLDPSADGNLVPLTVDDDPTLPRLALNESLFHLETFGDPSAPVIVMLHRGPGGDYRSMLRLRQPVDGVRLEDAHYVVFWDQRGSGLSRRHDPGDLTLDKYDADLLALIDKLSPQRPVVLIGHSWGGMYATEFIARHPERVAGAVLMDSGPFTGALYNQVKGDIQHLDLWGEWLNDYAFSQTILSPEDHARADYQRVLGSLGDTTPGYHLPPPAQRPSVWRYGAIANVAIMQGGASGGAADWDFTAGLEHFKRPVLFMASELNEVTGPAFQKQQMKAFPNASLAIVAGAGHEHAWTHAQATLRPIFTYLAAIDF